MKRSVSFSEAVNSTKPSPERIDCCEAAPASAQPPQPDVFFRLLAFAVTFATLVQFTASACVLVGAGVGDGAGAGVGVGIGAGVGAGEGDGVGTGLPPPPSLSVGM